MNIYLAYVQFKTKTIKAFSSLALLILYSIKGFFLFQDKKKSKSKGESKESSEAATESSQDKQEKIEGKVTEMKDLTGL